MKYQRSSILIFRLKTVKGMQALKAGPIRKPDTISPLEIYHLRSGLLRPAGKCNQIIGLLPARQQQMPHGISGFQKLPDAGNMVGVHVGGNHVINLRDSIVLECRCDHVLSDTGAGSAAAVNEYRFPAGHLKKNTVALPHIKHSDLKPTAGRRRQAPESKEQHGPQPRFPAAPVPDVEKKTFQQIETRHLRQRRTSRHPHSSGQLTHVFQKEIKESQYHLRRKDEDISQYSSSCVCKSSGKHLQPAGSSRRQEEAAGNPRHDSADHHGRHAGDDQKIDKNTVR